MTQAERSPGPSHTPQVGEQVGRYRLTGSLGRGGMGVVFRARDEPGQREVALKWLPRPGERARERFLREGRVAATLRHPGIVPVLEVGELGEGCYLVLELVEGARSLSEAWAPLGLERRAGLIAQACRALGHAHRAGLVHRDVKPDNVLVDASGRVRVTDFGLVTGEGLEALTATGAAVGTPTHMAPEVVTGERDQVGPPTDVWSLGVILYQALTDRLPFEGPSLVELGARIAVGEFVPPRELAPATPPQLEQICLRALAHRPSGRYPDAEAMAQALEAALRASRPASPLRAAGPAALVLAGGSAAALLLLARGAPPRATPGGGTPEPAARASAAPSEEQARARTLFEQAMVRYQDRDYAGAIPLFDASLALDPAQPVALYKRGTARMQLEDLPAARADLDRALALDPSYVDALLNRGYLLAIKLGDDASALPDYQEAARLAPDSARAWECVGNALRRLGRTREALEALDRSLSLEASTPNVWHSRALAREQAGDLAGAVEDLTRELDLAPDAPQALLSRGALYSTLGRWELSLADYQRATALHPDDPEGWAGLAAGELSRGRSLEALAGFERARALGLEDATLEGNLALALLQLGRPEEAEGHYMKALELDPRRSELWLNWGIARAYRGDAQGATECYERALGCAPGPEVSARCHVQLGLLELQAGRLESALARFDQAQALHTTAVGHANRGAVLANLGRIAEGRRAYEQALELDPGEPAALLWLADVWAREGDLPRARAVWERLAELGAQPFADLARERLRQAGD